MNPENLRKIFLEQGCLDHQATFAAKFLEAGSARKHLLLSSPGLGKRFAAGRIAGYVASHDQSQRVLVLAPPALLMHWQAMIRHGESSAFTMVVTRQLFRELEANQSPGDPLWPTSGVVVISIDLAKQDDITESLARTTWDLCIVDEAQHLTPGTRRYRAVVHILDRSPNTRSLLLRVATPLTADSRLADDSLFDDADTTVWSRAMVRGTDGSPLLPEVRFEWIAHHRRADEVKVLSHLQHVLCATRDNTSQSRFVAMMLQQTASSSLFALEQSLNRVRLRQTEFLQAVSDDDVLLDECGSFRADGIQPLLSSTFADEVPEVLEMIEDVETDSKLEALFSTLDSIGMASSSASHVCVFTSYVDTATYLESALSEQYSGVLAVTGSLTAQERQRYVEEFSQKGGVLIATSAMSISLPEMTAVIFYDLPLNPTTIDERIGQFIRIGRGGPVRVFALTDESDVLNIERLQRKVADTRQALSKEEIESRLFPNRAP